MLVLRGDAVSGRKLTMKRMSESPSKENTETP